MLLPLILLFKIYGKEQKVTFGYFNFGNSKNILSSNLFFKKHIHAANFQLYRYCHKHNSILRVKIKYLKHEFFTNTKTT